MNVEMEKRCSYCGVSVMMDGLTCAQCARMVETVGREWLEWLIRVIDHRVEAAIDEHNEGPLHLGQM